MLPYKLNGERGPLVVAMHWLGGSALTWTEVSVGLADRGVRFAALDLPGFGDAEAFEDFTIAASVEEAIATIAKVRQGNETAAPWFLMGHSMGGKFSAIVARAAADGDVRLSGLAGIVLISPSPPGPEPMKDSQRAHMLEQLGASTRDAAKDFSRAQGFVNDNVGKLPLAESVLDRSVRDVLRMDRAAFRAWLTTGSKEDWSARVRVLPYPALVLAGSEEPALGPDAQRAHTLLHLPDAQMVSLAGSGHLSPLERPAEVVGRIAEFIEELGYDIEPETAPLTESFLALIASDATSPKTREVLDTRLRGDRWPRSAYVLDIEQRLALQALVKRVVPDCGFDLTERVHRSLSQGMENGWRSDLLPCNLDAWRKGFASLDDVAVREFGVPFVALDDARQDALLSKARDGQLGKSLLGALHIGDDANVFNAAEMRTWFEDVRGTLARLYMAEPRTMERVGFTGFADEHGFTQITLDADEVAQ